MKSPNRRNTGFVFAAIGAAGIGATACNSSLSHIDAHTDALVKERSALLLGANITPELAGRPVPSIPPAPGIEDRQPATRDPAAESLPFAPADPTRDVAARLAAYGQPDSPPVTLTLADALRQMQRTSPDYLSAQEDYLLAAIDLLIERHLWGPRFFATSGLETTATGNDGTYDGAVNLINELRATQRLQNGGQVEARFLWEAAENLRRSATEEYTQASQLVLSANIPLMRGAGLAAREDLTQAERDLIYAARSFEQARRRLAVQVCGDYFDLLQQQRTMENQARALELLLRLEKRTSALVEAGRLAEFQKNIAANDVLRATSTLASQRERYLFAIDTFRVSLGLPRQTIIAVTPDLPTLPEPQTTPQAAAAAALAYRLDLQTTADRVTDAQRRVVIAENGTEPDVNIFGSGVVRTRPGRRVGTAAFDADDSILAGGVRVDWAIDRQQEKLTLRQAQIAAQRAQRGADQAKDQVVIESRAAARELDRARFSLQLAEEAVKINQRRAQEQELKADEVTAQQVVDTANALRDAENARDQSATDLRNAVLNYLQVTGQLRLDREGQVLMPSAPAEPSAVPATPDTPASP